MIVHRVHGERELHDRYQTLAAQQASLRRVAAVVAGGATSADVFAAIAREVGQVTGLPLVVLWRYGPGPNATVIGAWGEFPHPFQAGSRWPLDGPTICARVLETRRPARIDDFAGLPGTIAGAARETGIQACAGAPIILDGEVWGAMSVDSTDRVPLPEDIEDQLAEFTELVAAAISNSASREELIRLAEEQAALRRVATLVAQGVPPSELFDAVAREVGTLFGTPLAGMLRYEAGDMASSLAAWDAGGEHPAVADQSPLAGDSLATRISRTGKPAREDAWEERTGPTAALVRDELGVRSTVGSPVVVEGRVWGALFVHSRTEPLPADTEASLMNFTELVGTALSNMQARAEVQELADEQAELRRVATLVARQSPPQEVFATVAAEVGRLLSVDDTALLRYEDDETATMVARWGTRPGALEVGARMTMGGQNVATLVHRSGRPARIDNYPPASGPIGDYARELGTLSAIGCPIVVEGRLWGVVIAAQGMARALPATTESRVAKFTELIASAISNVQAQTDLAASRARIAAAADEERRRVVRDLHDGAQQRLVHTILKLKQAREALGSSEGEVSELVSEALEEAEHTNVELRDLAHGILPATLKHGGLRAAVQALASRAPVDVELDVGVERLPPRIEATAYFVTAEALTNVAKHARASGAAVRAHAEGGVLELEVRDDGVGGARSDGGGFVGLADRLAALDGQLRVESPAGRGTLVAATIPLGG